LVEPGRKLLKKRGGGGREEDFKVKKRGSLPPSIPAKTKNSPREDSIWCREGDHNFIHVPQKKKTEKKNRRKGGRKDKK